MILLLISVAPNGVSSANFCQCATFMRRDVIRLVTLDFVLRIVLARVVGMSFVVEVPCVYLADRSADMSDFRTPSHLITDFESLLHKITVASQFQFED
jgi:hypothetical protein